MVRGRVRSGIAASSDHLARRSSRMVAGKMPDETKMLTRLGRNRSVGRGEGGLVGRTRAVDETPVTEMFSGAWMKRGNSSRDRLFSSSYD